MSESMNMARFMLCWPNRPSEMRHFTGLPLLLYLFLILNYSKFVNSLDIFVSRVGPEADFHEVSSGRLHIDEGRNKVQKDIYHNKKYVFRNSFVSAMYLWRPLQL